MLTAQLIQFERTSYPGAGRAGANPQADLSLPTPGGSFFRIDNCLCLQIGVCRTVGGGVHRSEASPLGDAPNLPFSDICGPSRTPAPTGFSYCLVPESPVMETVLQPGEPAADEKPGFSRLLWKSHKFFRRSPIFRRFFRWTIRPCCGKPGGKCGELQVFSKLC